MGGSPTVSTSRVQRAKRVARACDYCRKKRLKCTPDQRPCLNCQLYNAECTSRDRGRRGVGARSAQRDDQTLPDADSESGPDPPREVPAETVIHVGSAATGHAGTSDLDHLMDSNDINQVLDSATNQGCDFGHPDTASHWNQDSGFEHGNSPSTFDHVLRQLGLSTPSGLWEPNRSTLHDICSIGDSFVHTSQQGDGMDVHPLPAHTGSNESPPFYPYLSPSRSTENSASRRVSDIGSLARKDAYLATLQRSIPSGVLIRKNESATNYIGANSVGASLALCLKDAYESQRLPLKSSSLDFLIEAGSYVEEVDQLSSIDLLSQKLPPQDVAERSIQAYLHNVNTFYPVVDETMFRARSNMLYTPERSQLNLLDYCLFYLVVSIGAASQSQSAEADGLGSAAEGLYQRAWFLMQDCVASPSEASMQVLLLHIIHQISRGKSGIAWVFCGLAVRIAQAIGLHRNSPREIELSERQLRLRSHLWLITFSFDASLSLSQGRPPSIADNSYDTTISAADTATGTHSRDFPTLDQIYAWAYSLSQVQNRFCNMIGSKESATERAKAIVAADRDLLSWKDSLPTVCRPDHLILVSAERYHHVLLLHLEYSNLLRAIHWAAVTLVTGHTRGAEKLDPRIRASENICVEAARSFIKGLNDSRVDRQGGRVFALSFQTINYIAAIAVLYRSILKGPSNFSARLDLEYLRAGKANLERDMPGNMIGPSLRALFDNMLSSAQDLVWNSNINRNSNDNDKDNNDDNNPHREA